MEAAITSRGWEAPGHLQETSEGYTILTSEFIGIHFHRL